MLRSGRPCLFFLVAGLAACDRSPDFASLYEVNPEEPTFAERVEAHDSALCKERVLANEAVSALMPVAVDRQTGLSEEGQYYVYQHTRFHFQNVQADEVNPSMPAVACRATLVVGEHQTPMQWRISLDSLDTADGVFVSTMDFQPQVTDAFHAAAESEMRGLEEARAKLRDAFQE